MLLLILVPDEALLLRRESIDLQVLVEPIFGTPQLAITKIINGAQQQAVSASTQFGAS